MTDLFDIEKFNVISDDENYYFFRNLGSGDIEDIEKGIITAESGYARIRTDRERWEESHENTKWSKESKVSLEEVYDHIKYNHSYQTNCISLTSNPYIAKMYGESFSKKYVMITVPKKEMGDRVFHVGKYMLDEIQKRIEEYLANNEVDSSVLEDLENVEHATNSSEIKELIKTRYVAPKPIDTRKSSMRKDITYSAPHSRISSWQALDEEQNLAKNKIIGKLTILEQKGRMPRILKKSKDNRKLLVNIGGSFSSAEQIYYGEIVGERVQDISKEMLDMFGLLQQAESQDRELVKELESELIRAVKEGKQLEIPGESPLNSTYEVKSDISIEEMYELTEGKVDYTKANDVVQKMFYLSRSRLYAVELVKGLNQLTGNNPKYKEIIDYIEKNGFNIEPQIFNRKTDSGVEVVGTVNLSLNENEKVLAEKIKELAPEEYIQVLENGGLYDVQNIISSTFSSLKLNEQMSKEGYYAQAIIDSYNWNEMSEKGLNDEARMELIKKLQEFDVIEIYEKLKKAGIKEKDISKYFLNIVSRESLLKSEDFSKMLLENEEVLKHKLSVEQVDRFLGYYDVKDSNFELRDYQQDAFDKSKELLSRKRFAAVVMPTGGGKSFVTLQHLLEHKNEKMLYLAPDDEILNQMMDYIIEYIPGLSKTSENTSKKEIVKQLFPNMEFETYPGLMATRSKELLKEQFDFIVLDELHRTGAEKWEKKLDELLESQEEKNRVLGITATPTRDVDGRDMSVETAVKLGYTREEAEKGEHIAYYLDLVEAIQLGLVVNPKIVSCEYTLTQDGSMERLKEKIESIEDEKIKAEKMKKFNELSRSLEKAEGIPEILQKYVKPGQKYIVFLPSTAMQTEDDKKIGEAKIEEYKKKLEEYFKDSEITPEFYSMLGTYSKGKNESQLREFETSSSPDTKFMIVIDKAREGLHIAGLNGMVWFRPLDENSNILYHQQLGRVIHSEDPLNPTKDEDRPIVIDLANNTFRVRMDKQVKTYTSRSDLDLLCAVIDWVQNHNGGVLPDVESLSKQEKRYAATLYRLQNKYLKYFDDENFEGLKQEEREEIKSILDKGYEIDLWDTELFPPMPEEKVDEILKVDAFEVSGVLKDFVELEEEVEIGQSLINALKIKDWCERNFGDKEKWKRRLPSNGVEDEEKILARALSNLRTKLNPYEGKKIEEIEDEECRKILEIIRKLEDEYAFGERQKHYYLGTILKIENWCEINYGDKEKWERRLPIKKTDDQEEKRLGISLGSLRQKLKQYNGKKLEEIENEEDRKILEIIRKLEDEYAFGEQQEHYNLGTILEIENWCKINYGDKEKWKRRLPITSAEDEEEKRLANALSTLRTKLNLYEGKKTEEIEYEEDRKILEIIRKLEDEYAFGYQQKHYSLGKLLEIENWCKRNFGEKKRWERRLPINGAEDEEKILARALSKLRTKLNLYEGKKTDEIEDEEDRKIAEIVRKLEDEYAFGERQKHYNLGTILEIENWCKINYGDKEKWERRLPIKKTDDQEEKRLGLALVTLRTKLKSYEGKKLEEIEDEEDKQVVEMLINLDDEYAFGRGQKHYGVGTILEIENWCKINYGNKEKFKRKLPTSTAIDEEEKRLGIALGNLRQNVKKYNGKQLEEIEDEDDRKIVEIIRRLDEEYNPNKSSLQQAKQSRDDAKTKNAKAKELEEQVVEELKKRGKNHEEQ